MEELNEHTCEQCENCGNIISNVAIVQSDDGINFRIGLDCKMTITKCLQVNNNKQKTLLHVSVNF
jgi:hypothetical protein